MSSRRQKSIPLGGRYRQVFLITCGLYSSSVIFQPLWHWGVSWVLAIALQTKQDCYLTRNNNNAHAIPVNALSLYVVFLWVGCASQNMNNLCRRLYSCYFIIFVCRYIKLTWHFIRYLWIAFVHFRGLHSDNLYSRFDKISRTVSTPSPWYRGSAMDCHPLDVEFNWAPVEDKNVFIHVCSFNFLG